jgi:hypothetical protein
MAAMEAEWKVAVAGFITDVLDGTPPATIESCEIFNRALSLVRDISQSAHLFDDRRLSSSFDCIRLTIRRGLYSIGTYSHDDQGQRDTVRNDVEIVIDEMIEFGLSVLRHSKTPSIIIAAEKFLLALIGTTVHALLTVAAQGGLDTLLALITPQPSQYGDGLVYQQPLSVLHSTIRVLHFLEVR